MSKTYLSLYHNWLFDKTRSIQNIPNPIPNQGENNQQEQRRSKEETKKFTMSTSESLLTVQSRHAAAKAPPLLFLQGGGSWWPRHEGFIRLYSHIGTQERGRAVHGSMLNKAYETCDTKSNSHTCITFIPAHN